MSAPDTLDDAIRQLARAAALVAVEACADRLCEPPGHAIGRMYARDLLDDKRQIAEAVAAAVMETADEVAEHEVHALRAFGGGR